ncbi:hypothetical protein GCK32_013669, partial [Trichostrongylus colubriformis]
MDNLDGLAKDGLSYRSATFTMTVVEMFYTCMCILWIVLIIVILVNNFRAYPISRKRKMKEYELLHVEDGSRTKSPRGHMSYKDSKSFSSDRDEWESKTKSSSKSSKSKKAK